MDIAMYVGIVGKNRQKEITQTLQVGVPTVPHTLKLHNGLYLSCVPEGKGVIAALYRENQRYNFLGKIHPIRTKCLTPEKREAVMRTGRLGIGGTRLSLYLYDT